MIVFISSVTASVPAIETFPLKLAVSAVIVLALISERPLTDPASGSKTIEAVPIDRIPVTLAFPSTIKSSEYSVIPTPVGSI